MMVWKGLFPGPTRFGCPSSRLKPRPRFCRAIPVPGTKTPEPNPW